MAAVSPVMKTVYVIGSLRNPHIPEVGNGLRDHGFDAFDDWFAGGKYADEEWMVYEKKRGRTYREALAGFNANHIFQYDLHHLNRADAGVLVLPAGKSAHLELGYIMWARQKPGFILCTEEPDRWDVMTLFAPTCFSFGELVARLREALG